MKQNYEVGSSNTQITFEVTVGTVGVAYTEFSMVKDSISSGTIAFSKPRSGNIEKITLGMASTIQDSSVIVLILINLSHLTKAQRESALATFVIEYKLEGGTQGDGTFTFNKNTDLVITPNQKIVSINTEIELI